MKALIFSFTVAFCIHSKMCEIPSDREQLQNMCLDSKYHKSKPGPEAELFQQCTPWKNRSCCTHNTTQHAHYGKLYNFNFDHCSHKKNLSQDCRRHFIQDQCFYECSPNVGPWVVKILLMGNVIGYMVQMKIRNERFFQVPLCQEDCDAWFNACLDDYTCTDNWGRNFNWTKDGNTCLEETECKTFRDIYETSNNFCEKVWDHSWQVVSNDLPCMRIWFDGSAGNPNDNVAKLKIEEQMKLYSSFACSTFTTATCLAQFAIQLLLLKLSEMVA